MVAMGIFLIMMTIMMQFFTSAQKVWNASAKRNMIYSDARVAMNLMTREIQSLLYYNDGDDLPNSIYPFWYEWYDINNYLTGSRPQEIKDHYLANNELFEHSTSSPYLTALNFISTTDLKPVDKGSDVCEIRYRFVPVYFTDSSPESAKDVKGGELRRSCVAEYYPDGTTSTGTTGHYNFSDWQYKGPTPASPDNERMVKIWPADAPDPEGPFQKVIDGVYSLRFTCYRWNGANLEVLAAMDSAGNGIDGNPITAPILFNLSMGTPAPVAVRIDMKLMDPKDLKQLALNIYREQNGTSAEKAEASKQIKTLKQKIRTFSKVIYLGKREDEK
jgi:hypothetical protein